MLLRHILGQLNLLFNIITHSVFSCINCNCNVSCHRVSLKHTLKKKGRAFRNIGKYTSLTMKSALLFFCIICSTIFLLIRSFTPGSGTFILSRWSLQTQFITGFYWIDGLPDKFGTQVHILADDEDIKFYNQGYFVSFH